MNKGLDSAVFIFQFYPPWGPPLHCHPAISSSCAKIDTVATAHAKNFTKLLLLECPPAFQRSQNLFMSFLSTMVCHMCQLFQWDPLVTVVCVSTLSLRMPREADCHLFPCYRNQYKKHQTKPNLRNRDKGIPSTEPTCYREQNKLIVKMKNIIQVNLDMSIHNDAANVIPRNTKLSISSDDKSVGQVN